MKLFLILREKIRKIFYEKRTRTYAFEVSKIRKSYAQNR